MKMSLHQRFYHIINSMLTLKMEPRGFEPLSYYLATNTSTLIVMHFKFHKLHAASQSDQLARLIILFCTSPIGEHTAQITKLLNR